MKEPKDFIRPEKRIKAIQWTSAPDNSFEFRKFIQDNLPEGWHVLYRAGRMHILTAPDGVVYEGNITPGRYAICDHGGIAHTVGEQEFLTHYEPVVEPAQVPDQQESDQEFDPNDVMEVAERLYSETNPGTKMDVPSSVYEAVEGLNYRRLATRPSLSLYEYCKNELDEFKRCMEPEKKLQDTRPTDTDQDGSNDNEDIVKIWTGRFISKGVWVVSSDRKLGIDVGYRSTQGSVPADVIFRVHDRWKPDSLYRYLITIIEQPKITDHDDGMSIELDKDVIARLVDRAERYGVSPSEYMRNVFDVSFHRQTRRSTTESGPHILDRNYKPNSGE